MADVIYTLANGDEITIDTGDATPEQYFDRVKSTFGTGAEGRNAFESKLLSLPSDQDRDANREQFRQDEERLRAEEEQTNRSAALTSLVPEAIDRLATPVSAVSQLFGGSELQPGQNVAGLLDNSAGEFLGAGLVGAGRGLRDAGSFVTSAIPGLLDKTTTAERDFVNRAIDQTSDAARSGRFGGEAVGIALPTLAGTQALASFLPGFSASMLSRAGLSMPAQVAGRQLMGRAMTVPQMLMSAVGGTGGAGQTALGALGRGAASGLGSVAKTAGKTAVGLGTTELGLRALTGRGIADILKGLLEAE